MTMSHNEIQVKWATANTKSVAAASNELSDAFTFSLAAIALMLTCKADNNGTPASGDYINWYIVYTTGDPDADADSADEYGSADTSHAVYLGRTDTNVTDPALINFELPVGGQKGKLWAKSLAASNGITVSAQINEVLGE